MGQQEARLADLRGSRLGPVLAQTLLNDAAEAVAQRYIWNNQLELEFEEVENEYEY